MQRSGGKTCQVEMETFRLVAQMGRVKRFADSSPISSMRKVTNIFGDFSDTGYRVASRRIRCIGCQQRMGRLCWSRPASRRIGLRQRRSKLINRGRFEATSIGGPPRRTSGKVVLAVPSRILSVAGPARRSNCWRRQSMIRPRRHSSRHHLTANQMTSSTQNAANPKSLGRQFQSVQPTRKSSFILRQD